MDGDIVITEGGFGRSKQAPSTSEQAQPAPAFEPAQQQQQQHGGASGGGGITGAIGNLAPGLKHMVVGGGGSSDANQPPEARAAADSTLPPRAAVPRHLSESDTSGDHSSAYTSSPRRRASHEGALARDKAASAREAAGTAAQRTGESARAGTAAAHDAAAAGVYDSAASTREMGEAAQEKTSEAAQSVRETAGAARDATAESASELYGGMNAAGVWVRDATANTREAAAEGIRGADERIQQVVHDSSDASGGGGGGVTTVEAIGDFAGAATDGIRGGVAAVAESLGALTGAAKESTGETVREADQEVLGRMREARRSAERAADDRRGRTGRPAGQAAVSPPRGTTTDDSTTDARGTAIASMGLFPPEV